MKKQSGRVITTLAGGTLALVLALGSANPAFAASGKVKYSSRVRQSADSNSKAIGSFSKDATVDLLSQVTDANGQVWFPRQIRCQRLPVQEALLLPAPSRPLLPRQRHPPAAEILMLRIRGARKPIFLQEKIAIFAVAPVFPILPRGRCQTALL